MKSAIVVVGITLFATSPAVAQLSGAGTSVGGSAGGPNPSGVGSTRREVPAAIRQFRDRPFGSMGTGTIMGASGTDSAMGTGGSIGSGTGHGSGIAINAGWGMDLGSSGYRFSPTASPTNPAPIGVTGSGE